MRGDILSLLDTYHMLLLKKTSARRQEKSKKKKNSAADLFLHRLKSCQVVSTVLEKNKNP